VRFALDEFRDYVLARQVVKRWRESDTAEVLAMIEGLVEPGSPVAEGVSRFLFFAARGDGCEELRAWMEKQQWYEEIFLECVFSLEESQVDPVDASHIEALWKKDWRAPARVFWGLWYRDRAGESPACGIELLLKIMYGLDERDWKSGVRNAFRFEDIPHKKPPEQRSLDELVRSLEEQVVSASGGSSRDHQVRCAEFLLHLSPLVSGDRDRDLPAARAVARCVRTEGDIVEEALMRFCARFDTSWSHALGLLFQRLDSLGLEVPERCR